MRTRTCWPTTRVRVFNGLQRVWQFARLRNSSTSGRLVQLAGQSQTALIGCRFAYGSCQFTGPSDDKTRRSADDQASCRSRAPRGDRSNVVIVVISVFSSPGQEVGSSRSHVGTSLASATATDVSRSPGRLVAFELPSTLSPAELMSLPGPRSDRRRNPDDQLSAASHSSRQRGRSTSGLEDFENVDGCFDPVVVSDVVSPSGDHFGRYDVNLNRCNVNCLTFQCRRDVHNR